MNNYQKTLDYLYNQLPVYQNVGGTAYKEGLDNSLALSRYFNNPHEKYRTIHVGGTNGKGSTSHLLAAVLQSSGYKVGLYTSPHLVDFRERIRINGEKISEKYVIDFVEKHRASFEPIHPSFFELTMMMAFQYFADENVDVAVIEVGLGGRLDSTNIISPDLSVITNISFDHVQFLGDTLEKIAREKAGIIKNNTPVVIGEAGNVRGVFDNKAIEMNASITFAEDFNWILTYSKLSENWIFETKEYPSLNCELGGEAQVKNTATVLTAICVLKQLNYNITNQAVYNGFAHVVELTGLMGRWQLLQTNPKVVCDTGHNIAGFEYIVHQLSKEQYEHLHIVIGMVNDKDISNVLAFLPTDRVTYYFTQASIPRALNASVLKEQASVFGLHGDSYSTVMSAVEKALENTTKNDFVFIGGSNFVVGEALPLF